MNFQRDLKIGNEYEKRFCHTVLGIEYNNLGYNKGYDILHNDGTKYEVKADFGSIKSGNFFIEFECSGKPSGITTTESDYYAIYSGKTECYVIPTSIIKAVVKQREYSRIVNGGDYYRAKGYLIKKERLLKFKINCSDKVSQ